MAKTIRDAPARVRTTTAVSSDRLKEVAQIIADTLDKLNTVTSLQRAATGGSRLFPSGVELISFRFQLMNNISLSFSVAGKDAPTGHDATAIVVEVDDSKGGPGGNGGAPELGR